MNKTTFVSLLGGLCLLLVHTIPFAGVPFPLAEDNQHVPDQILVKFKPGVSTAVSAQMAQAYGVQSLQAIGNQSEFMLADLMPGQTVGRAVGAYNNDPDVAYAQPNYIYHATAVPNDPQYSQLWAAKNTGQTVTGTYSPNAGTSGYDMNLESAWNVQADCSSVVVAVVDTGINYNSTDLAANMWAGNAKHGQNFALDAATGVGSDPMDLSGHGTHVAGIIGAVGNNGIGGVGVCWKTSLMAVRVLDATGAGTTSAIVAGIAYAVANGAKVINMSLSKTGPFDQLVNDAITNAQTRNVLVVTAAGNSAQSNEITPNWPCNFTHSNLICVAALDQSYALATFSDWGATSVDVGAPGTNILSTWAGTSVTTTVPLDAGWFTSTSSSGGFSYGTATTPYGTLHALNDPGTWPSGKYKANTTDHAWKTFDLSGTASASLDIYGAVHVTSDGSGAIAANISGGDPFAVATPAYLWGPYYTDSVPARTPTYRFLPTINLKSCLSATCTIGFALKTGATLDLGTSIAYFQITTLTLNSTSYNTIGGTSMATPEVAGVAAMVWAHNPLYTYTDVANAIKNGGRSIPALSGKTTTGKAVDTAGALTYITPQQA